MGEACRIIVVDDEPELRRVLSEYLAKHGFCVRTAAGGAELDRLLDEAAADLLILDVTMPGEDGISIARRNAGRALYSDTDADRSRHGSGPSRGAGNRRR